MQHCLTNPSVCLVFFILTGSTGLATSVVIAQGSPGDAKAVVERLVSFEHGLNERVMDDGLGHDVEQIKMNPQLFLKPVQEALGLSEDATQLATSESRLRLERALQLARLMGREHGGPIIRSFYDEIAVNKARYSALETQKLRNSIIDNLRRLNWLTLGMLADLGDAHAVDGIISEITTQHPDDQHAQLEYLTKVARHRPDILPKLEEMYESPDSPLRNNPQLARAIESIDRTARDRDDGDEGK